MHDEHLHPKVVESNELLKSLIAVHEAMFVVPTHHHNHK